ncbi:MAG: site-specific integrase [Bacteroidota bacterium]
MATIDIVLFTSKILKNGEHPIMIRIIKDRKPKYISTGERCAKELWDKKKNQPAKKHPLAKELTIKLEKAKTDAKKTLLNLEDEKKEFSLEEFGKVLQNKNTPTTVIAFIDLIVSNLIKIDKIGNANVYKNLRRVLVRFRDGKDFEFSDLDLSFLKKFEQDFRERGLKETSMSNYFRTLRSVYSKAIEDKYAKAESDPFLKFKISKFNTKTKKRAISSEFIKKIEALTFEEGTRIFNSQKAFMFSYYCMGLNINDLMKLKWENIKNGIILEYLRSKTKREMKIPLNSQAIGILNYYRLQPTEGYIFNYLSNKIHKTAVQINNRIKKVTKQINEDLKVFAGMVGVESSLTTYVTRHSSAQALKKAGTQGSKITQLMGHQTERETIVYLDDLDPEDLRNEVNLL